MEVSALQVSMNVYVHLEIAMLYFPKQDVKIVAT